MYFCISITLAKCILYYFSKVIEKSIWNTIWKCNLYLVIEILFKCILYNTGHANGMSPFFDAAKVTFIQYCDLPSSRSAVGLRHNSTEWPDCRVTAQRNRLSLAWLQGPTDYLAWPGLRHNIYLDTRAHTPQLLQIDSHPRSALCPYCDWCHEWCDNC